ncbi:MAG: UpxY family transcription antiterminator, partial [Terrimonas sp.]|nr:UpxY family transcription antiterminator [Terrimonas sp.]
YTKPRWEKKVAESLTKKGFEQYCPLNKVQKQWHDRKKIVLEPLFSSYVFVKTNPQSLSYIKSISGVVNFVHWLGKPAIVRNEEIEAIESFLGKYENVHLEKTVVNVNDAVKITQGPLIHREGRIVQVNNNSVKIELPSIGYALVAQISKFHIEITSSSISNGRFADYSKTVFRS